MFGYVNIYKDELKVRDYKLWQGYYCGLCKTLEKNHNAFTRLGLNYDMTFLAVVIGSAVSEKPDIKKQRCFFHPLNKRYALKPSNALKYACDASIVLTCEKLSDDINDDKRASAFFMRLPYKFSCKKAKKNIKAKEISEQLFKLYRLEKAGCKNIDEIADCFAVLMAELMTPDFIPEEKRELLYKFGYNLGRWIYIIDAVNDYYEDKRKNKYNPFTELNIDEAEFTLTYTLSKIGRLYRELDFKINNSLIENIIFLGLRYKQEMILKKASEEKERLENNESL